MIDTSPLKVNAMIPVTFDGKSATGQFMQK
jgi:hypothetical protein